MRITWSFLIAAVLAFSIGWYMLSGEQIVGGQGATADAPAPPSERVAALNADAVRVRAMTIQSQPKVQVLEIRGRTEADAAVMVAAETVGRIVERPIDLGQVVAKNDLLCRLDAGAREAKLGEAEAGLEQANAAFEAARKLNERGFTTDIQLKTAQAARDTALAEVREAVIELEWTEIRSPIDGVVESNLANIGDVLSAGMTCAMIMNPDPMLVIGQVSEREVNALKVGMNADVWLVSGEQRAGTIRFIGSSADEATRTFRVEIELPNPKRDLRSGVTARADVKLPSLNAHRFSPAFLTLDDAGRIGVRIVNEQSQARFLPVSIIGEDNQGVWTTGLPDRVQIITVGQEFVIDGEPVDPIFETAQTGPNS